MQQPTKRFVLKFHTSLGRVSRISIPRADATKDAAAVIEGMTNLIDSNTMLFSNSGSPLKPAGAKLVQRERRVLL